MKNQKRLYLIALLGIVAVIIAVAVLTYTQTPPKGDQYLDHTPPPGPNARPDKPNPDKIKKLPGAAAPG